MAEVAAVARADLLDLPAGQAEVAHELVRLALLVGLHLGRVRRAHQVVLVVLVLEQRIELHEAALAALAYAQFDAAVLREGLRAEQALDVPRGVPEHERRRQLSVGA